MKNPNKLVSTILIVLFLFSTVRVRAESVDDQFAELPPTAKPTDGEFIHGQGYGKILMRVLMFGSVPKQGVHYVPEGTDLLFAILYAGGYGENSKLNGITIRRRNLHHAIEVDLEDLVEDGKPIPKLVEGDVVTVPWNWRKDFQTVTMITTFLTSLTSLTLSIFVLTRN